MSRDIWYKRVGQGEIPDEQAAIEAFRHSPLAGRTSDPEAADFDEASELFYQGVRLARSGDLEAARAQIATAYLLDGRSIHVWNFPPENPELAALCIDFPLLYLLAQADKPWFAASYGGHTLRLLLAVKLGRLQRDGQNYIAEALRSINFLIQRVKEQPELGEPRGQFAPLGGCMAMTNLLFQRSCIFMALGNEKKAISDLSKALEVDPSYSIARDARASLWANSMLKDDKTIHAEFKRLVSEMHPDNRALECSYAWLAIYTLKDATLGTVTEAKRYYEKSLQASSRRAELYKPHAPGAGPGVLKMMRDIFAARMRDAAAVQLREEMDTAFAAGRLEDLQIPDQFVVIPSPPPDKSLIHSCLNCGKTAKDIGRPLSKCARCKKVSYCGRDCQVADWRKHKGLCTAARMKPSTFAAPRSRENAQQEN